MKMTKEYSEILVKEVHKLATSQSIASQVKSVILGYGQGLKPQSNIKSVY